MKTLLAICDKKDEIVHIQSVLQYDILPWLGSSVLISVIYYGISAIISETISNEHAIDIALATLYQQAIVVYLLIFCGCFLSVREASLKTWLLLGILVLLVTPQSYSTLANNLFPNSVTPCLIAMMGILSIYRLAEFIRTRFCMKLQIGMTKLSIYTYVGFAILAVVCQFPV